LLYRFLIGGAVVMLFAAIGDVLRPKSFAGIFGAAPSISLATLGLTVLDKGPHYVSAEAKTMIAGAVAFVLYAQDIARLIGGATNPLVRIRDPLPTGRAGDGFSSLDSTAFWTSHRGCVSGVPCDLSRQRYLGGET